MKRIIILVLCLLVCIGFSSVEASGSVFAYNKKNIEGTVGQISPATIEVIIASENDSNQLINQSSVKFVEEEPDDGINFNKVPLSNTIVQSFFASKPLPTGLSVVSFQIDNPVSIDDDPDGLYDATRLRIIINGRIDSNFDVTGYENDLIELSIPKQYLLNYESDTPLTLYAKYTSGVYKITCTKYEVTFDMQGHGTQIDAQKVQANFKASRPADPSESGYSFINWYKEPACENVYDFDNEIVTSDITLYAKWEEAIIPYIPPVIEPVYEIPNTGIE